MDLTVPMECACCSFVRKSFVCRNCSKRGITRRRAELAAWWKERDNFEQSLLHVLAREEQLFHAAQRHRQSQHRVKLLQDAIERQSALLRHERELRDVILRKFVLRQETLNRAKQLLAQQREASSRTVVPHAALANVRNLFAFEANQRIEELLSLYVVKRRDSEHCSIVGIVLPDNVEQWFSVPPSEENTSTTAAALGYLSFLLLRISQYLGMWMPYPLDYCGSTSTVSCVAAGTELTLQLAEESTRPRALTLMAGNIRVLCTQNGVRAGNPGRLSFLPDLLSLIQAIGLRFRMRTGSGVDTNPSRPELSRLRTPRPGGDLDPESFPEGSDTDSEEWDLVGVDELSGGIK